MDVFHLSVSEDRYTEEKGQHFTTQSFSFKMNPLNPCSPDLSHRLKCPTAETVALLGANYKRQETFRPLDHEITRTCTHRPENFLTTQSSKNGRGPTVCR